MRIILLILLMCSFCAYNINAQGVSELNNILSTYSHKIKTNNFFVISSYTENGASYGIADQDTYKGSIEIAFNKSLEDAKYLELFQLHSNHSQHHFHQVK